ncbi:MAG: chromosomal replication initiator protein DnaA [bacterium]|nr:chromosomal replication initiator protein DnaA [bacterium]
MEPTKIWSSVLVSLEKKIDRQIYNNYLKDTKIIDSSEEKLVVEVNNKFQKEYIHNNLLANIRTALKEIMEKDLSILFKIHNDAKKERENPASENKMHPTEEESRHLKSNLNPYFTFENFVVGANTELSYSAAIAVANAPAHSYNPLFIYGGVGLGKTHILNAIGNRILQNKKDLNVLYVVAEKFTNDLIHSLQNNKMDKFRANYRKIDILIVDDVQFISGKERTQEEFFHTFNTLHSSGKQIILTADKSPKEIPLLEERLRSRFGMGLITDIGLPDIETREAILYKKAENEKTEISPEVIHFLAKKIKYNIRDLQAALINLIAISNLMKKSISLDLAKSIITNIIKENAKKETSITRIQEVVADYFGINLKVMTSKRRNAGIVLPRQVAMYLIRELTNASTTEIGNVFGSKDHSTVIHAIEKIKNLRQMDNELHQRIEKIVQELNTESV